MQPDPANLLSIAGISRPLVGAYDAPDPAPFAPLVEPPPGRRACVFSFYRLWLGGQTLHLTAANYGCGGAGHWLCGVETRSEDDFVRFLVDDEGLKASHDLMREWLAEARGYCQRYPHILIGPLHPNQYEFCRTITFWVTPDQLGLLMLGAQYHTAPTDPPPVLAPFGSGCSQLLGHFDDLEGCQAVVGATDIAMRQYIPPDLLAFTVTRPMFEQLCALDESSFLYKPFWRRLMTART